MADEGRIAERQREDGSGQAASADAVPAPQSVFKSLFAWPSGNRALSLLYWILIFLLCCGLRRSGPDLWGHLLFGRDYLRAGRILTQDIYSYTVPGAEWYGHEALFEITAWLTYARLGVPGLILYKTLFGLGTALFVFLAMRRLGVSAWASGMTHLLVVLLVSFFLYVRPQLLSFLGLAVYSWALSSSAHEGKRARLVLLPIVMVPWANAHGGFIAGFGLACVYLAGGVLDHIRAGQRRRRDERKRLVFLASMILLSLPASLVNPIGIKLWYTVWRAMRNPYTKTLITEWARMPFLTKVLPYQYYQVYAALLIVLIVLAGLRKWSLTDLAVALVGIALPLSGIRHIPLFAVMVAPVLARGLQERVCAARTTEDATAQNEFARRLVRISLCGLAAYGIVIHQFRYSANFRPSLYVQRYFPVRACKFLQDAELSGNISCQFNYGEYLIWQLGDRCKVAVDGRYDTVYPVDLLRDFVGFTKKPAREEELPILERYATDMVLIATDDDMVKLMLQKARPPLLEHTWTPLYRDDCSTLFVRDGFLPEADIARLERLAEETAKANVKRVFPTLRETPAEAPLPTASGDQD